MPGYAARTRSIFPDSMAASYVAITAAMSLARIGCGWGGVGAGAGVVTGVGSGFVCGCCCDCGVVCTGTGITVFGVSLPATVDGRPATGPGRCAPALLGSDGLLGAGVLAGGVLGATWLEGLESVLGCEAGCWTACCWAVLGSPPAFGAQGLSTASTIPAATTIPPPMNSPVFPRRPSAGVTVIVAVALAPSHVHVIRTSPSAIAFTRPWGVMVAISGAVEAQVTRGPTSVLPPVPLSLAVSCTAPPATTDTCWGTMPKPVPPVVDTVVFPACVRPGIDTGVVRRLSISVFLFEAASVISCVRTGSSGVIAGTPMAEIASSTVGKRSAGSLASIRMTAF